MRRKLTETARKPVISVLSVLLLALLLIWLGTFTPVNLTAGDNLDMQPPEGGPIFDLRWDPRLFNGSGFIQWFHNPTNLPINQTAFEAEIEAAFNNWEAVGALPGAPPLPVVNKASTTTTADVTALDGINTVGWFSDGAGGLLARAPCYYLTAATTTYDDGGTRLPIDDEEGSIPFPGAPGVTYPPGTAVDCWMEFDSQDSWSTAAGPVPFQFDIQSIATHEGGHFLGVSHSTVGLAAAGLNSETATMVPAGTGENIDLRSLAQDDIASLIRTYARNATPPIEQTAGGRGLIEFTLRKGPACDPATGVSVWAYETAGGIDGANRVETFSGSQLKAALPGSYGDTFNGSVKLNVPPGGPYTIYARTLEDDNSGSAGLYSAFRYNFTTIHSNTKNPPGQSTEFDQLASVGVLNAGDTVDLGDIGILDCWTPVPGPAPDLQMDSVTAPADGAVGSQIAVTSNFSNQGTVDAGAFEVGFYFSTDPNITIGDVASVTKCNIAALLTGANGTCNGPVDVPPLAPGVYYVGAIADTLNSIGETNESNNSLASAPITISGNPLNPIVNGSFETGDFTGWTIKELQPASNPNLPLTVGTAGVEYPLDVFSCGFFCQLDYFGSSPTDGVYAALHDFNGDDPATPNGGANPINRRELYQDVTLPATTTTLEFDYRAAWELFRFGSTMDRVFSVEIEPAGGGALLRPADVILLAVNGGYEEDTDTGIAPNPPYPNGYPDGIVDLSAFSGLDVRIKFVWNVPQPATGFAFFQLDNVRLNATVTPLTDIGITAIDVPASVDEGDLTPVTVTVQNLGNQAVTSNIAVTLAPDANGGAVIGNPQTIVGGLSVGQSTQLLFTWDSLGASEGSHTLTASHDFGDEQASNDTLGAPSTVILVLNTAPTVEITAPATGSTFTQGDTVNFIGTADDTQDGDITANLAWASNLDGSIGSAGGFSTSTLSVGVHTITASVEDAGGLPGSDVITVTIEALNTAPTVEITAPANLSTFTQGGTVNFTGTANDTEDGNITANLSWNSNLNGSIGSGGSFSTSTLNVGIHTITASVTDAGGLPGSDAITVTIEAPPPPPSMVDNLTSADFSTPEGTIIGSHVNTHVQDDGYEALTEVRQGKGSKVRSSLTHTWTLTVVPGSSYMFKVDAYHTPNGEGDDFVFAYSTNNSTFTNMLTVTKTVDNDVEQTFTLPGNVAGTLYIRVVDTNNAQGSGGLDTLFVDFMAVTTVTGGADILPPGAPTGLSALGSNSSVALNWNDNAEPDLNAYRVYRSTTSGSAYTQIASTAAGVSQFQDGAVTNGTTYYYVVTALDTTGNESPVSAQATATPAAPGSATSVHVASIVTSTVNVAGNRKRGRAVAVIVNNLGIPVGTVSVTGTFTGSFSEVRNGTTNGSGSATIETNAAVKGTVNFTFCVNSVTGGLPYQASDNVVTCDSF